MDIIKVIHVYDAQGNIFGTIGVLLLVAFGVAVILSIAHLFVGQFKGAIIRIAIAIACFFGVVGCGALITDPTIQYEVVISDMKSVEDKYYIVSVGDDGTYIVEPKQDGGAE